MSDLERRIEALEKVNRRWRYAAVLLGSVLLIALVSGAKSAEEVPDLLQAKRIEVVRPDGKPGIVLEARAEGSALNLSAQGPDHERRIALAAHEEGVSLWLMKHAEAPLLTAEVDDDGAVLNMFDGRQPSQDPRGILLRAKRPSDGIMGGTAVALTHGSRKQDFRAGMFTIEPSAISYLHLGGPKGKTAAVRVNQDNGKLEVFGEGSKRIWTTP
ncbi:MAG: hypothetical protein ACYS8Z_03560 [Planctomycetota bacterium]|jgi:hypothetical protein